MRRQYQHIHHTGRRSPDDGLHPEMTFRPLVLLDIFLRPELATTRFTHHSRIPGTFMSLDMRAQRVPRREQFVAFPAAVGYGSGMYVAMHA